MATGLSLSPLVGNRWNGHGDNVICGMEFELSCAHRLFGGACKNKKYCKNKKQKQKILMLCPQSGHLGIRKINTQCETKYGAQVQEVAEVNTQFLKVIWHFVTKDWFPQPTNLRTPLFSISDSVSTLLLNISRDGVSLGKGRLTAPSASLGEVSSFRFYSPPSI